MNIELKKFGVVLTSRQSGKEAYAAFSPLLAGVPADEKIAVDFSGVVALSPSWADEFFTPLLETYGDRLSLAPSDNPSVKLTISTLEKISGKKFNSIG